MVEEKYILSEREGSSMVSTWKEYLTIDGLPKGQVQLAVCMYEGLREAEYDDDGEMLPVPEEIDGTLVVGVEDGIVIGGSLACYNGQQCFFAESEKAEMVNWISENGFKVDQALLDSLAKALASLRLTVSPS